MSPVSAILTFNDVLNRQTGEVLDQSNFRGRVVAKMIASILLAYPLPCAIYAIAGLIKLAFTAPAVLFSALRAATRRSLNRTELSQPLLISDSGCTDSHKSQWPIAQTPQRISPNGAANRNAFVTLLRTVWFAGADQRCQPTSMRKRLWVRFVAVVFMRPPIGSPVN